MLHFFYIITCFSFLFKYILSTFAMLTRFSVCKRSVGVFQQSDLCFPPLRLFFLLGGCKYYPHHVYQPETFMIFENLIEDAKISERPSLLSVHSTLLSASTVIIHLYLYRFRCRCIVFHYFFPYSIFYLDKLKCA